MSATATTSVIDRITDERCAELLVALIRQRSVVGEETTAHRWMADRLREAGMRVEEYSVENTGYTFVPVKQMDPYVSSTPTSCQMKRPAG